MSRPTVIIMCGGEGSRWGNYLGVEKHFIPMGKESLLYRTVRQFSEYPCDIWITGPNNGKYEIPGTRLYPTRIDTRNWDVDKFLSSRGLWNTRGRTIVVFGDVYFTNEAVRKIMGHKGRKWCVFGRIGASSIGVSGHSEMFAQSFYPMDIPAHEGAMFKFINIMNREKVNICAGGWGHYKIMMGGELWRDGDFGSIVRIDDLTNDFDSPVDYRMWKKVYDRYN